MALSRNEAFEQGNAAYHAGKPMSDNPYPYEHTTLLRQAWREGWLWGECHKTED
jgi:hypothetical protein